MTSIASFVRARAVDGDRAALRFEDQTWTWSEFVRATAQRAAYLDATRPKLQVVRSGFQELSGEGQGFFFDLSGRDERRVASHDRVPAGIRADPVGDGVGVAV